MLDWYSFHKSAVRQFMLNLCLASGAQNVDEQFFLLGWDRYGLHKNASGHLMPNLCFCILWYMGVR
jgi:hypothetical protein